MTDTKLRELERRWNETGSVEDEAAYVRERVRAGDLLSLQAYLRLAELSVPAAADYLEARLVKGDLRPLSVQLAAQCGHLPAQRVRDLPSAPYAPSTWVGLVDGRGHVTAVRLGLAAAETALPIWASTFGGDEILPRAMLVLRESLEALTEEATRRRAARFGMEAYRVASMAFDASESVRSAGLAVAKATLQVVYPGTTDDALGALIAALRAQAEQESSAALVGPSPLASWALHPEAESSQSPQREAANERSTDR